MGYRFHKHLRTRLAMYLPDRKAIGSNRWLAPFENTLLHPRLWHFNRRSVAGGVAAGLFCGLIPGPLQMLSAAICAVIFRINLPLALLTTLYTNPFTILPLYAVAFALGQAVLGGPDGHFALPPEAQGNGLLAWLVAIMDWLLGLGMPLALGLVMLATGLAILGYALVRLAWRIALVRSWRQRQQPPR